MSHHKIEAQGITYRYPDKTLALDGVSFTVTHGESVGVLGANGAGKSTLLAALVGLIFPQAGAVAIGDARLTPKTAPYLRQRLGMLFQNPDDQLFMTTVYEDAAFGPRNLGLDEADVARRVQDALERTGILHLREKAPNRLSGGEKRAAAIAGVLAMAPDALVLDEPSGELDPKARRKLIALLKTFTHTKIVASHDIDMIYELCERTVILKDGKITADGKTKEIVLNEKLMEANV